MEGHSDVRVVGSGTAHDLDASDAAAAAKLAARRERQLESQRKWARRNAAKLKAYRAVYRKTKAYKAIAARNSRDYHERRKKRGVARSRLSEPRTIARLSACLRWQRQMESSNGACRPSQSGEEGGLSFWEWCGVFGVPRRVRAAMAWADLGSRSVMADRWLSERSDAVDPS
jgi:hypothetical protein